MNKKPEWITPETLIDTTYHPTEEIWIEEHQNPNTEETIWLVINTSGSDYGFGTFGLVGIFDSFTDACNRIGDEYGYNEFWEKKN